MERENTIKKLAEKLALDTNDVSCANELVIQLIRHGIIDKNKLNCDILIYNALEKDDFIGLKNFLKIKNQYKENNSEYDIKMDDIFNEIGNMYIKKYVSKYAIDNSSSFMKELLNNKLKEISQEMSQETSENIEE